MVNDTTYIAFGDVHGIKSAVKGLEEVIKTEAKNGKKIVVGVGDYFDYDCVKDRVNPNVWGASDKENAQFLREIKQLSNSFLYPGNHDEEAGRVSYQDILSGVEKASRNSIYVLPDRIPSLVGIEDDQLKAVIESEVLKRETKNPKYIEVGNKKGIIVVSHKFKPKYLKGVARLAKELNPDFIIYVHGHTHNEPLPVKLHLYRRERGGTLPSDPEVPYLWYLGFYYYTKDNRKRVIPMYIIHPGIFGDYIKIHIQTDKIVMEYNHLRGILRGETGEGYETIAVVELTPQNKKQPYRVIEVVDHHSQSSGPARGHPGIQGIYATGQYNAVVA